MSTVLVLPIPMKQKHPITDFRFVAKVEREFKAEMSLISVIRAFSLVNVWNKIYVQKRFKKPKLVCFGINGPKYMKKDLFFDRCH